jgi:hypothetical protein
MRQWQTSEDSMPEIAKLPESAQNIPLVKDSGIE